MKKLENIKRQLPIISKIYLRYMCVYSQMRVCFEFFLAQYNNMGFVNRAGQFYFSCALFSERTILLASSIGRTKPKYTSHLETVKNIVFILYYLNRNYNFHFLMCFHKSFSKRFF